MSLAVAVLWWAATLVAPLAPSTPVVRVESTAFGQPVEIAVLDPSPQAREAREAISAAQAEIAEIERLTDPGRTDGGLGALNATAGQGPQPVPPRLLPLLVRGREFCLWTEGAHGALGRDLYQVWGVRTRSAAVPAPEQILRATAAAACNNLGLDAKSGRAALAAGAGLDLLGFAEGEAVDRAVEVLKQRGITDGRVRVGGVYRAFGKGPQGKGWPVVLPAFKGMERPDDPILLRDQALAIADAGERPLEVGGEKLSPYLNQRTGVPTTGVVATIVVTQLAGDASPLAASLLITGPREGQLRIGSLRPRPSALWLLGNGLGAPLRVVYRWTEVTRPAPKP